MTRLVGVALALALLRGPAAAAAAAAANNKNNPERTFMAWMLADADATPAAWAARIANIKAHTENMTAVSPCVYDIAAAGTFAKGTGSRPYAQLYPHMKEMQAMGLEEEAEPSPWTRPQLTSHTNSEGRSQGKQQSLNALSHAEPRLWIHEFAFARQFCEKQRTFYKQIPRFDAISTFPAISEL